MKYRKILRNLFLIIVTFTILCSLLFLNYLRTKPLRGNYLVLEYSDGNVVFFQAGDREFSKYPNFFNSFVIAQDYRIHGLESKTLWKVLTMTYNDLKNNNDKKCDFISRRTSLARIVYGELPDCYKEFTPPQSLEIGESYYTPFGFVPQKGKYEYVYFVLRKCEKDNKVYIETNSPKSLVTKITESQSACD